MNSKTYTTNARLPVSTVSYFVKKGASDMSFHPRALFMKCVIIMDQNLHLYNLVQLFLEIKKEKSNLKLK